MLIDGISFHYLLATLASQLKGKTKEANFGHTYLDELLQGKGEICGNLTFRQTILFSLAPSQTEVLTKIQETARLLLETLLLTETFYCVWQLNCHGPNKTRISKIVILQEKEKTYFTSNVSQWNQIFFPSHLGRFFWSIYTQIYTQCKGQQTF